MLWTLTFSPSVLRCDDAVQRLGSTPEARGTMVFDLEGFSPSETSDGAGQLQVGWGSSGGREGALWVYQNLVR